jgi:glycosyltransferase involved in cell wall biosynthesis
MRPLRVLYIHHAGPFGGASRSLLELIHSFPEGAVQPLVLTRRGQFLQILEAAHVETIGCGGVSQFDNSRYGFYRGMRWLILLREIAYLPTTLWGLLAARRRWRQVDLVHINDLTLIPPLWFARQVFACPVVVHVRGVQNTSSSRRGRALSSIVLRYADRLIAIDETVRRSLDPRLNAEVIHNGLRIVPDGDATERSAGKSLMIGMVGGLSRAKGCLEFLEAARICRDRGADIRCVFVGQSMRTPSLLRDMALRTLGLSQEIHGELQERIAALELRECVEFWPFTTELDQVYRRLDLVCFPSHFDAPGRPIFEAAFFGIPSIAAISSPTPDTIVDGETGLTVKPRAPAALADAIMCLYENPRRRLEMGRNAARLAKANFDARSNAARVLGIYRQLVQA